MKKNLIVLISVLLFSVLVSCFVLYTPMPNGTDEEVFNTKFAMEYISEIAQEPHSVYDPETHEEVRLYLKSKLEEYLGIENVTEMNYPASLFDDEIEYDINNLFGVIPGNSDTAILLVAHYDSRGHIGRTGELGESYGAADDGYGLATLLEVARLFADKELENTIYILMTDGEETGLYGASKAALEDSIMDNVGFVINLEARGVTGPAYMFETSTNNDKVIDFYKEAELPVSYSLATAVYTVMPNSTDFTEFLAQDKNGINFAVLNGLYNYHTPFDNYTNIDSSSIQHYGTQVIPLVEEFTMNTQYSDINYFDASSNQVFFTFLPNLFITYTELTATILHITSLILLLVMGGYLFWKKEITVKKIGASFGLIFGAIVSAVIVGSIVSRIIAFLSKVPYNMTYVRTTFGDFPSLLTLLALTIVFGYLYWTRSTNKGIRKTVLWSGGVLNLLLALLTGFALSGASFLFLVPGATALIVLVVEEFVKNAIAKQVIYAVLMALNVILILPILYSLYLALTIGGLLALGAILVFYLILLIPLFVLQIELKA